MLVWRVVGSLVSTQKNAKLEGTKLLQALDRGTAAVDAAVVGVVDSVTLVD